MKPNKYWSRDAWLVKILAYATISTSAFFYLSGVDVATFLTSFGIV